MLQDVNNTLISKFTERPDGELYDPDELLKREARKKRVQAKLAEKKQMPLNEPKIANAYSGDAKFSHLSNFAPRDFVFEDKPYRNVEHAYQTNKSGTFDENVYNKYVRVSDVQYKIAGQKVDKEISIELMEQIVTSMYKQNPEAYQKLLDTENMTIEHNIPNRQADIWTKEMPRILTALRDNGLDAFVKVTDEVENVIKVDKFWDRAEVAADTEYTYLFGDNTNDRLNTQHTPTKTQAVIRGLPNAIGIDTRYSRTQDFADTDDNFARFQQHVDEQIQKALDIGKPIKVSAGGFATGAGVGLPQRFKDYLNNAINMIGSVPSKPTELKLTKIISGMQKNVDQYGIEAAKVLGLDYGGTVNKGFKVVPEGSNSPNFQEFVDSGKWEQIESQYYPDRTKANAQNADGTVWFGEGNSTGYGATKKASGDKPWIENPETPEQLRNWMIENNIETLNVAGNRSYGTEELGKEAQQLIIDSVQGNSASGTKAVENSVVKIFYPYSDKNSITNHANSYKKIMEEKYPNLTVEIVNNKSQADMVFGRGQGMGNPFSHESKHKEVIVKTRFFDETMLMYEAWLKGEPMPPDTVPINPEQQEKLDRLRNEWLSKTQKYIPGSSVGAMAADVETKINDIKIDDSIVQDVLKNLPGWFIVPIEQAAETVLRRIGIAGAASLASKLIKYELQTFATAIASGGIAAGTSALTVPETAQAMLLTGNYDEFNKRVDTLEEDMMENAKINGGIMMGMIVRLMPSYWLDEWFLKRNPEFKNTWKETFPQMGVTPGFRHVGDTIAKGWNNMFPKDKDNE
jgi:predicted NAD-dependent protein-ADP-ribosyltransferase YbiA (DUF1768 family)